MEISLVNQSEDSTFLDFEELFHQIASKSEEILEIKDSKEMSVVFVNDQFIQELNRDYRNIDRATDVISFALNDSEEDYEMPCENSEIGDIFISVDRIKAQAKEYGHSIKRETCFLFTHGLLHLLGYDHMEEADEKKMSAMQDVILNDIVPKENNS